MFLQLGHLVLDVVDDETLVAQRLLHVRLLFGQATVEKAILLCKDIQGLY